MSEHQSENDRILAQLKEQANARSASQAAVQATGVQAVAEFEKNPHLLEWIHPVQDPEMLISIVDLGLVYEAKLSDTGKKANVIMTLTSAGCPVADVFVNSVKTRLLEYPGIEEAEVKLVFEPKWDPKTMASDEVKDKLGIW